MEIRVLDVAQATVIPRIWRIHDRVEPVVACYIGCCAGIEAVDAGAAVEAEGWEVVLDGCDGWFWEESGCCRKEGG